MAMRTRRPQMAQGRVANDNAARLARVSKYLADGVGLKQACRNVDRSPGWYKNLTKQKDGANE